ncbi:PAS domain S-box protein [Heliophilum fasciatum]|uniref:histidine kinase n=1 Tax=Heliophilum fasciatum TaxID=35700 RepID=A0A4R2RIY7_9FIRM|nr:PAS domain S-box protein [Heliophilum fasciatum]MCW2278788.1 PAS domain S-box-containing protein [Heliophilum fasciatum]TCP62459.1 PAS domain S-box-containing protein [Heliophilum fasciatum]
MFQEFFEQNSNPIVLIDHTGTITHANQRFISLSGYPKQEMERQLNWKDFVAPDDRSRLEVAEESWQQAIEQEQPRYVYQFINRLGQKKTIVMTITPLPETKHIALAYLDISAKSFEHALRESEIRYRLLVEHSPDGILIHQEGRILFANQQCANFVGLTSPDDLLGQSPLTLIHPESLSYANERLRLLKEQQQPLPPGELMLQSTKGKVTYIEVHSVPITFNGQPAVLTVARDITERKKIEGALRLSEERYLKAFEASPNMGAIVSLGDHRYLDVNNTWQKLSGYTKAEVLGKHIEEIPTFDQEVLQRLYALFAQCPVRNAEITFLAKNGEKHTVYLSADIIHVDDQPCIFAVAQDITELKKYRNEINRLDQLHLLGETAAGIAHEIRNPMTTVRGYLQIYQRKPDSPLSSHHMDLMIKELDRANHIITEFLSIARTHPGDQQRCDLNQLLEAMEPLLVTDAVQFSHQVIFNCQPIPQLLLNQKEIRQLLLNLVHNGFEAMAPGGRLIIATSATRSHVLLQVSDYGSGISPEHLKKLGTPFFTTKDKGTGLGLAICYSIAARHQANIEVQSSSQGTTFSVRFPRIR